MTVKLVGRRKKYEPKDTDEVKCEVHGIVTTWGDLDHLQRLAVEEGLDTVADSECLLAPSRTRFDRK